MERERFQSRFTDSAHRLHRRWSWLLLPLGVLILAGCAAQSVPETQMGVAAPSNPFHDQRSQALEAALAGLEIDDSGRLQGTRTLVDESLPVDELLEAAAGREEEGYRTEAIALYTEAILRDPDQAAAYESLGLLLMKSKRPNLAVAAFRRALDLEPRRVEARFLLAELLQGAADFREALSQLETLLSLVPRHGEAHGRIAVLLHYSGRDDEALQHLDEAEQLGAQVPSALRPMLEAKNSLQGEARLTVLEGMAAGVQVAPNEIVIEGDPDLANETAVAASSLFPSEVVAAWNDFSVSGSTRIGVGISLDSGGTWIDTGGNVPGTNFLRPPPGFQSGREFDPMAAVDPLSGDLWVGGGVVGVNGTDSYLYVARRPSGASSFDPPRVVQRADNSPDLDKPLMTIGRRHGDLQETRLFVAYRQLKNPADAILQYSDDEGVTWSTPFEYGDARGGLHPRVGPGGELYIVGFDSPNRYDLVRSLDGGTTFSPPLPILSRMDWWGPCLTTVCQFRRIPGRFPDPQFPSFALDPFNGDLFVVYFDSSACSILNFTPPCDVDLFLTVSTDQGNTWSTPVSIISDPPVPQDQFFPWLEVDEAGRLHLLYYQTAQTIADDQAEEALVEAYYALSLDRGQTWSSFLLTDAPFSSTDAPSPGFPPPAQFIGDYQGLAVAGNTVYPAYLSIQKGNPAILTRPITLDPPPTPKDDFYTTYLNTPLEIFEDDLLINDSGLGIVFQEIGEPVHGTLTPIAGGYSYQPPAGFTDVDTVAYRVAGATGMATATLHIEVFGGVLALGDDFENGIDPAWQVKTQGTGSVSADAGAALQGAQGLRTAVSVPMDQAYLQLAVGSLNNYIAAFQFDPSSMAMNAFEKHVIFEGWKNGVGALFQVRMDRNGFGQPRLQVRAWDDDRVVTASGWTVIEGPVAVRVEWQADQLPFPAGGVQLQIDGQNAAALTNDNGHRLDSVRLGFVRGGGSSTSGHHKIDSFLSRWVAVL